MEWYLVQSKPRQEHVAALNVQRLGVESFCPRIKQSKIVRWKKQVVIETLFPGYLFALFDRGSQFRTVNFALGVARVITFGGVPARVDEEIINSIKTRIHDSWMNVEPKASFKSGQKVQITEGPFCGLEAVFEQQLSGTQRVALLLQAVSYHARVIIERRHVAAR